MGLNLLTALILQRNEVRCFAIGPFPNNKYGSVAYLIKDNQALNPVISIEHGSYNTCKEAIDNLENVIKIVRGIDLTAQEEELETLLNNK